MSEKNHILIVDDDPMAQNLIGSLLCHEGYEIFFADNGMETLRQIEEVDFDVILLDVMMPEMDGYSVCQYIKTNKRLRHIPIILVTALDTKKDIACGLEAGADDFLSKPVSGLELRARVRSMLRIKRQYDELAANVQSGNDLAQMIVHDMRMPLNAIVGYSDLLLFAQEIPSERQRYIDGLRMGASRLNALVEDLLSLAKMESKKMLLKRSPIDIIELLKDVATSHYNLAQTKGIRFTFDIQSRNFPRISLDEALLYRVMDNLLANAVKFSPLGSTIVLRLEYFEEAPSRKLRIKVCDEGPGIPREYRNSIFDKFSIIDLMNKGVFQTGLGLAFCKLAVESHDGRIFVEENNPKGLVFVVEI